MPEDRILFHGIDEAGYGPLLGPLVIARSDARPCSARGRRAAASFAVDDSKRLFGTRRGRARVEAALLGALRSATGRHPESLGEWLALDTDAGLAADLAAAPWYADLDLVLPHYATEEAVSDAADAAGRGRLLPGRAPTGLQLRVVTAGRFNREVERLGNKHRYLFGEVCRLAEDMPAAAERHLTVDRLGGRKFYGEGLGAQFPFRVWETLEESRHRSVYRAELEKGTTEVSFVVGADGEHPEVSLASMAAKYTRELLMELFNRHWCGQIPELRPTAGYYTDGRRFLDDLARAGCLPAESCILMRGR